MPKAASSVFTHVHDGSSSSARNANALRRNQACHQCRRRKLKCDAKRPCTTCVRSHAYALAHAPAGSQMPPHPDCTYDVVPEIPVLEQRDPPKSRIERLESRISELESLLSEKARATAPLSSSDSRPNSASPSPLRPDSGISNPSQTNQTQPESLLSSTLDADFNLSPINALDSLADAAILADTSALDGFHGDAFSDPQGGGIQMSSISDIPLQSDPVLDIISLAWPRNLPIPDLLRHLVDAYFSFNPDANRLFHRSTFMTSLALPPTHPKFPATAVLHAMCAVGSLYTAAVSPTPQPMTSPDPPDDPFDTRNRMRESRPESFAEMQARHARREIDTMIELGEELFQSLQAELMLNHYYWASAKWAESYMSTSRSLRCCMPLGLNLAAPFVAIADSLRPPSIIPPAKSVIEEELRRNVFWIVYSTERTAGCGYGWALLLDDQDVSQLMPLPSEQYEQGVYVDHTLRQWSHDWDVLTNHPPGITDAFVLYIKSCLLLSRVKSFNSRFRTKFYSGDPSTVTFRSGSDGAGQMVPKDIRETPAFVSLNQLIEQFRESFPPHLRHPVQNGVVTPHLFSASTAPLLATILLHETHAHVGSDVCPSSLRILTASRGILNLIYDVCATSYNLSLLGQFGVLSWFMAARVLVRFLRAAIDRDAEEIRNDLVVEVEFLRTVLAQVGERIPLAYRYSKLLSDFIRKTCGDHYAIPPSPTLYMPGAPQPPPNWHATYVDLKNQE